MAIKKYIVRAGFTYRTKDKKGADISLAEGETVDLPEEEGGIIHLLELADPKVRSKAAAAEAAQKADEEAARQADAAAAAADEAERKAAEELANQGSGNS